VARTCILLLALLAACTPRPSRRALTITDDWGRAVALAAPARRIVSLSPATTELLFALGLGPEVVGRTRYGDWPPEARAVPDVGEGIGPSVEVVAARRPDLVLVYASAANRGAVSRLEAMGIQAAVFRLDLAADLDRAAVAIGVLAGAGAAARGFVAAFDSSLRAVAAARAPRGRRPRVYVDVWPDPPMTVGRGSYLSQLVRLAGAENLFDDVAASSATVSLESIVARDPDAVLVVATDTARRVDLAARPGWRAVPAVREGRVLVVDASLYARPSPRLPLAAADLAARLARLAPRAGSGAGRGAAP
jgi:iron complex transport system substrate-binding protein